MRNPRLPTVRALVTNRFLEGRDPQVNKIEQVSSVGHPISLKVGVGQGSCTERSRVSGAYLFNTCFIYFSGSQINICHRY